MFEHGRRQGIFVSDRKVSTFVVFDLFFAVLCLILPLVPVQLTPQNQQKNVKFHGTYRDDDLVYGKFTYPNGEVREGPMLHGKINGIGRLVHPQEHIVYHGSFRDGYFNGKGNLYMHGALVYEGDFQHDKPHGKGRQTPTKGCMCAGEFQNGVLHGMVAFCLFACFLGSWLGFLV